MDTPKSPTCVEFKSQRRCQACSLTERRACYRQRNQRTSSTSANMMSRAAMPKRGSSKFEPSSRLSTSSNFLQSWDAPEDYVNAIVTSAVGAEHSILRDGRTAAVASSVTVYTNVAGAVAVTVDQASLDAGRRLRSRILPENLFNPFRRHPETKNTTPASSAVKNLTADGAGGAMGEPRDDRTDNDNVRSSVAACNAAEEMMDGVREELNRWAAQTSRRESVILWKHECSRYASFSSIGYHRNQPSASRSGSRPLSAATFLQSFSTAGPLERQMKHQSHRSSSAFPPRSLRTKCTSDVDKGMGASVSGTEHWGQTTRPRSPVPLLGTSAQPYEESQDTVAPRRGVSAPDNNGFKNICEVGSTDSGGDRSTERSGSRQGEGSAARRPRTSSARRGEDDGALSEDDREGDDDVYDDIYEDLDEDDGELDNRISIMETRFSTLGRERIMPSSAIDRRDGDEVSVTGRVIENSREPHAQAISKNDYHTTSPARNMRPPRAPSISAHATSTRRLASAAPGTSAGKRAAGVESLCVSDADRMRSPCIIKTRPISAPSGGSPLSAHRSDLSAALRTRRARGNVNRPTGSRVVLHGQVSAFDIEQLEERQQQQPPGRLSRLHVRDVTTAIPSWDRCGDGGGSRPLSSATIVAGAVGDAEWGRSNTRPSSAAFMRWMDARPSARSAVSAVSSARTLGMDDPELVHLQMEMESRRGGMSEATLARMEDHYTAVTRKNEPPRKAAYAKVQRGKPPSAQKVEPNKGSQTKMVVARSLLPNKDSGAGGGTASTGSAVKSRGRSTGRGNPATPRGSSRASRGRSSPSRSKINNGAAKKISKQQKRKKKGRSGSPGKKGRGKRSGKGKGSSKWNTTPRKVYASAAAFMAEHFPTADDRHRDVSHLGMEQLEECRRASEALGRAGMSVSSEALRRALVIPTDRSLEACLAALPTPLEGFRDRPVPIVPNPAANSMRQTAAPVHLSGWMGDRSSGRAKRLPPGGSAAGQRARRQVKSRKASPLKRIKSTRA